MTDQSSDELSNFGDFGDYNSEFEYDSEVERKRAKRSDLARPESKKKSKVAHRLEAVEELSRDEGRKDRYHLLSLDAFARHKKFINDYLQYYGGSMKVFKRDTSRDRTDHDVIKDHHQFLWSDDDVQEDSWEKRLAKKYYDKLFKEYCIGDLSRYKENKVALRWRIEAEVISGKGQFICGEKRCTEVDDLKSWEVNFAYMEQSVKKNALVKIRLCPECSRRLNYHHRKREVKSLKRKAADTQDDAQDSAKSLKSDDGSRTTNLSDADKSGSSDDKVKVNNNAESSDTTSSSAEESNIWAQPLPPTDEVSREEEFESYFNDMFL